MIMAMTATAPQSYAADPLLVGLWVVLTGIPAPFAVWLLVRHGATSANIEMTIASLIVPVAVLIFASRFRAIFHSESFEYRRWGSTIRVPYADIAAIETTNVTPVERQPVGAFIVTRTGTRLPFWPKLFPKPAVERFFQLADSRPSARGQ